MRNDIVRWCNSCELCARSKPGPGLGRNELQQFNITEHLQFNAIDIFGPLPVTNNGNQYIMVIGDYFTKWKEAFAIENHTALTIADRLFHEFICKYGCPEQIHTDQGREFESDLFKTVCHKLGVHKTRTTPYGPQSDGMLSIFTNENPQDWDNLLHLLIMAYRATEHKSTGCSPNLMMFGRGNSFPIDLMAGLPPNMKDEMCEIQYVEWLKQSMENVF